MNHNIWKDFISLFYPNTCLICHQILISGEVFTCVHCLLLLSDKKGVNILSDKFLTYKQVVHTYSMLFFEEKSHVQRLIHSIKYKGNQALAIYLGKLIAKQDSLAIKGSFDFIVPVPLHPSRKRQRGYNQSELLGLGYSEISKIPLLTDQVKREKKTVSQTKKSKLSRWKNMKQVYGLTLDFKLAGKNVLLIDDVITTGATISGIIDLLILNNVKSIGVISLASER